MPPLHDIYLAARSRAEVVELGDERKALLAKASIGLQLCLEDGPSLVYGAGVPRVSKLKEVNSWKRKLPSSMVSAGKNAENSEGGEKDDTQEV